MNTHKTFHVILTYMLFILFLTFTSCGASLKLWTSGDLSPPSIISIRVIKENTITIEYNEQLLSHEISIVHSERSENIEVKEVVLDGVYSTIYTSTALIPGEQYTISIIALDTHRNSALMVESVFGYNPRLPTLLINEFLCEGSKTRPDKVEVLVLEGGLLAGLAIQQGGITQYNKQIRFPSIEVAQGDFIIVHWLPSNINEYESETVDKNHSTHPQAYENAWDIFATVEGGLSNTNGSISIVNITNNTLMDAVIYSTKTDDDTHKYRGFASSKPFLWAEEIAEASGWEVKNSTLGIMPSDTLNPKDSTTTRSIGRNSSSSDTDSNEDWHISPSKMSSFGEINTDLVYTP